MKFCMDFVTNSSSGSTFVTYKASLESVDLDVVRRAFGLKGKELAVGTAVKVYESSLDEGEDMWPFRYKDNFDRNEDDEEDYDEEDYEDDEQEDDDAVAEGNVERTFSKPVKQYIVEKGLDAKWHSLENVDALMKFVNWFNKKHKTKLKRTDLLIETEHSFGPYGESASDVADEIETLYAKGFAFSMGSAAQERLLAIANDCEEFSHITVEDGDGLTRKDYHKIVLSTAHKGLSFGGLVALLAEADGHELASAGTRLLSNAHGTGLGDSVGEHLGRIGASLLYFNGTHSVLWIPGLNEVKEFHDLESLAHYAGAPARHAMKGDEMLLEDVVEDLVQYYGAAGFTDFQERVVKGMSEAEIRRLHTETFKVS